MYDPATFTNVDECAECHPQHYDEWQGSAHAYAVVDPVFWAGNEISYETNGIENFCITCHSPVSDITNSDPEVHQSSQAEVIPQAQHGVDCQSCHRIYDVTNGGKQLTFCEDYYFGPFADPGGAPHGVEEEDVFTTPAYCRPCHDVNISNETHDGLTQIEFTYTEWAEANEAAGGSDTNAVIQTCQDCHMPTYTGEAAVGWGERELHEHRFAGVDVALLPFADSHQQYRAMQRLLSTAAALSAEQEGNSIRVEVTNKNGGHSLPSGAAHAREVWVHITVAGADGAVYLESGDTDANGDLRDGHSDIDPYGDPWVSSGESAFRQGLYDKNGNEVLAAYGSVTTVERDMLEAGEVRDVIYNLQGLVPAEASYPIAVNVELLFRPAGTYLLRELGLDPALAALVPVTTLAETSFTIDGGL
ncbi:cytochrome c family protein [Deltaproteobacteria bacterium]|nr:cytochrome c family protein [Deltaproteobacteria bacterium]